MLITQVKGKEVTYPHVSTRANVAKRGLRSSAVMWVGYLD